MKTKFYNGNEKIEVRFRNNKELVRGQGKVEIKTTYGQDAAAQAVAQGAAKGWQFISSSLVK